MRRKGRIAVIYFLLAGSPVYNGDIYAQNNAGHKWKLGDCLSWAASRNLQVNSLQLSESAARQDLIAARAQKSPGLSGTVSNSFNHAKVSGSDGHLLNQLSSGGTYSLGSSVTLWNDHSLRNRIRQRELLLQSAGLAVEESVNNLTFDVTAAYLDILLAQENLAYINDLVSTSEARVRQGQILYDAGSIALKDLLQLQAQLAGDKYLRIQLQNTIRLNILTLKQILQLPTDSLFDIDVPAAPVDIRGELTALPLAQQHALQHFPEVKISQLDLDLAALDITLAKSAFRPALSASAGIGTGYSGVITNGLTAKPGFFTQAGNNFYQRLGFTLSIPIFTNRVNQTNLEKANIYYRQSRLNLDNTRLLLLQNVERAWLSAVNAREAYAAAKEQFTAAAETYRIANEQFRLGALNTYDLFQQRNQYVEAVQSLTQAKYSALLQQKIYEYYMGIPVSL